MRFSTICCTTSVPVLSFFQHTTSLTSFIFFFFNDTATTEIYTLSLHDALPISAFPAGMYFASFPDQSLVQMLVDESQDRKSTRLNSSHTVISYAVFCLKKKNDGERERDPLNVEQQLGSI